MCHTFVPHVYKGPPTGAPSCYYTSKPHTVSVLRPLDRSRLLKTFIYFFGFCNMPCSYSIHRNADFEAMQGPVYSRG